MDVARALIMLPLALLLGCGGGSSPAPAPVVTPPAGLGIGASLAGYVPFPADNPWNQDISGLPTDPASDTVVAYVGASATLHPDFGAGLISGAPIGIPYALVAGTQARVAVHYQAFADESDLGAAPIPVPPPYEGAAPTATSGDRHVLVLDRDNHWLYELYAAQRQPDGSWNADSGATWDLTVNDQRPLGWTSSDAAGLPVFAGLARYDEVAAGEIKHALRLTVAGTRKACVLPATHWASSYTGSDAPPMGARFRLKAAKDISGFGAQAQVVLKALKKYGMILADNGSSWYLSGAPDDHWNNDDLHTLTGITGADLELVRMGTVATTVDSGPAPAVTAFTATPATLAAGASSTLAWTATNATRYFVSPDPGPVRGTSVSVKPAATTTYTIQAEGPYGSSTATVQVTVTP